ncbi:MAG: hypothetical protein ACJ0BO_04200 [Candidatus Puniceispirillaceae bacterium]
MIFRLLCPTRHPLTLVRGNVLASFSVVFTIIFFSVGLSAGDRPNSFSDLADRLSPSVVNIYSTTIVNGGPGSDMPQFPPGSPFEEFFKILVTITVSERPNHLAQASLLMPKALSSQTIMS